MYLWTDFIVRKRLRGKKFSEEKLKTIWIYTRKCIALFEYFECLSNSVE